MDLIDVMRHGAPPRTEYFLEVPSPFGELRLDIPGDVGAALAQAQMAAESTREAQELIGRAEAKLQVGDGEGGLKALMEVVKQYPYSVDGYGALYNYYSDIGNRDEAIYYLRQIIALNPQYKYLTLLGKELGRAGRYDEALALQSYLWEKRGSATPEEALNATNDYLVTLGRTGGATKMMEVSQQAMNEMGNVSRLVYQYIYAHILDKQYATARELLNNVLPELKGADPLFTRFIEMSNLVDELLRA